MNFVVYIRWHPVLTFVVLLGLVGCAVRSGRDTALVLECQSVALQ